MLCQQCDQIRSDNCDLAPPAPVIQPVSRAVKTSTRSNQALPGMFVRLLSTGVCTLALSLAAATKFLPKAIKRAGSIPGVIVSDKWRPTGAAIRSVVPSAKHLEGKRLNNRAEKSHQPTRRRERKQLRFKSAKSAQRFLSTFSAFYNHFNIQRHLISKATMKQFRADVALSWKTAIAS